MARNDEDDYAAQRDVANSALGRRLARTPDSTPDSTQERGTCPNCARAITLAGALATTPTDGCALEAMMRALADRGDYTDEQLAAIWRDVDVDALWDDLGEVLDKLGAGTYARTHTRTED